MLFPYSRPNKQLTFLGCAVANTDFTYYCEIHQDKYHHKRGIYTYTSDRRKYFKFLELMQFSDKVWRQGPKGGVKIVKDRNAPASSQYVTKDEKIMKEFMWVKLQAQPYVK